MRYAMRLSVLPTALLLVACANPYARFYQGQLDGRTVANYVPSDEPLQIYTSDDFTQDIRAMARRGYAPFGWSSFNAASNPVTEQQLRKQAEMVKAGVVLVSSRYANTVAGAMPLVLPNNTMSVTTGNATVTATGGVANANRPAATSTSGWKALIMPYSVQPSDLAAVYFVKVHPHFGVFYGTIDEATRERLRTDGGVLVNVIVDGSPAARADVLPGDIILTAGGQPVDGDESLTNYLQWHTTQEVVLGIDRNGQRIDRKVKIDP
jgi:hypothetical protein